MNNLNEPVPEICTRLAGIRKEQGDEDGAVNLYLKARDFLTQRLKYDSYFGNRNIMKWLIDDLYELLDFDEDYFDFYDLYYLLKTPHKIHTSL